MTHEHGSEYQVRIVHEDGSEELSGWMNRQEDVAKTIAGLSGSPAITCWLQARNILCLNCQPGEMTIEEFRLIPTAAENTRFPRQTDRRPFGFAKSRASSTGT